MRRTSQIQPVAPEFSARSSLSSFNSFSISSDRDDKASPSIPQNLPNSPPYLKYRRANSLLWIGCFDSFSKIPSLFCLTPSRGFRLAKYSIHSAPHPNPLYVGMIESQDRFASPKGFVEKMVNLLARETSPWVHYHLV